MAQVHRLRHRSLTWRRIDDEVIALDLEGSEYLSINVTGMPLWEALAEGATIEHLESLLKDAGAPPERAADDVAAFLAELDGLGLLDGDG